MKTAANCESQCKMHYLLNRSSTCRTQMAAHHVGHACPRVGYTSARARSVLSGTTTRGGVPVAGKPATSPDCSLRAAESRLRDAGERYEGFHRERRRTAPPPGVPSESRLERSRRIQAGRASRSAGSSGTPSERRPPRALTPLRPRPRARDEAPPGRQPSPPNPRPDRTRNSKSASGPGGVRAGGLAFSAAGLLVARSPPEETPKGLGARVRPPRRETARSVRPARQRDARKRGLCPPPRKRGARRSRDYTRIRPRIRRDYPLDLSISASGGRETN